MNEYFYIFKDKYTDIIKTEYHDAKDKINYEDIREMSRRYDLFIRKLMFLIIQDTELNKLNFRELFNSSNILDRLKGLKESRKYIKLVGENNVN